MRKNLIEAAVAVVAMICITAVGITIVNALYGRGLEPAATPTVQAEQKTDAKEQPAASLVEAALQDQEGVIAQDEVVIVKTPARAMTWLTFNSKCTLVQGARYHGVTMINDQVLVEVTRPNITIPLGNPSDPAGPIPPRVKGHFACTLGTIMFRTQKQFWEEVLAVRDEEATIAKHNFTADPSDVEYMLLGSIVWEYRRLNSRPRP